MNQKRTVVVAGTLSALLLSASAAFAVGSGLFSSGTADKVGTFQAIERTAAARRPASNQPSSATRPDGSRSAPAAPQTARNHDSTPGVTESTVGATAPGTVSPGFVVPPATTPGEPEDHGTTATQTPPPPTIDPSPTAPSYPEHEVEPPDSGRGSDD
jgi:hypothetical protein